MTIKIQTALDKDAMGVPPTVVLRGLDQHFVYRVNADKVEVVPVQMVYQDTAQNIIKGVSAGDVLVSDGQSRLKAGARIEVLSEPPQAMASSVATPLEVQFSAIPGMTQMTSSSALGSKISRG